MTNILREVREKKGMSIAELARKAGVARQTIYNLETNPSTPATPRVMESISAALGVKITKIFLL